MSPFRHMAVIPATLSMNCEDKNKPETARFVYEDYVQNWLKMIQGNYMPVDGLKLGAERPPMPFSDTTLLNVLSHTLWFLPNVASCYAMRKDQIMIICLSGRGDKDMQQIAQYRGVKIDD